MLTTDKIVRTLWPLVSDTPYEGCDLDGVLAQLLVKGYDIDIKIGSTDPRFSRPAGEPREKGAMTLVIVS